MSFKVILLFVALWKTALKGDADNARRENAGHENECLGKKCAGILISIREVTRSYYLSTEPL